MTEPMIPLSVIDAVIEKLEIEQDLPNKTGYDQDAYQFAIKTLEETKKEAIPSPDYEQKIKDRIKELERWDLFTVEIAIRLDELRKLLE